MNHQLLVLINYEITCQLPHPIYEALNYPFKTSRQTDNLRRNLNNSRASRNSIVINRILAARQNRISLPRKALGDRNLEPAIHGGRLRKRGPRHGNKRRVDLGTLEEVAGRLQNNLIARVDGHLGVCGHGHGGERLDGEGRVGGRARGDEGRGERVDLVEGQGGVKGLGEGLLGEVGADVGRVARLDGQDGARGGEVRLGHDVGGGAEVGGDADALEDGGGGEEALDVGVAKVVGAGGGGGDAGGWRDRVSEHGKEQRDARFA